MGQEETALSLIGLIYDAAGEPSKWPNFLEMFADALRGTVTTLLMYDTKFQNGNIAATVRIDPAEQKKYNQHFGGLDVWAVHGKRLLNHGSVRSGEELCPDDVLIKSEFYNDFLEPINAFHEISGIVVKKGSTLSAVTSLRSKAAGPFGDNESRLFQMLMPHLERALQLHHRIIGLEADSLAAISTLDHLHIGLIRLDGDGKVLSMNRAAEAIIAQGDGLTATRGGLQAARTDETRRLRLFIAEASLRGKGIGFGSGGAIAISRPSLKRPLSVFVSPAPTTSLQLPGVRGTVVIFVTDPEAAIESDEEILKRLFGLTSAEASVATLLVQGHDLKGVCGELSIRMPTARTHLRHLFDKLGVHRQCELISLLLRTVGAVRVVQPSK
jgi:DNA-binding CsgD family transcriptional regulator/PAS domain-containing protein